jgi:hypothetical protein
MFTSYNPQEMKDALNMLKKRKMVKCAEAKFTKKYGLGNS